MLTVRASRRLRCVQNILSALQSAEEDNMTHRTRTGVNAATTTDRECVNVGSQGCGGGGLGDAWWMWWCTL